jgi:hypothetical protein
MTVIVIANVISQNLIAQVFGYSNTKLRMTDRQVGECVHNVTILLLLPEFDLSEIFQGFSMQELSDFLTFVNGHVIPQLRITQAGIS